PEPRAGPASHAFGQPAADPAVARLVGFLRPGLREPEPSGVRRPDPRPPRSRPPALVQLLPARHAPGHGGLQPRPGERAPDRGPAPSESHPGRPAERAGPPGIAEPAAPRTAPRGRRPGSADRSVRVGVSPPARGGGSFRPPPGAGAGSRAVRRDALRPS